MRLDFILLGPPKAGKTELGLRMLGTEGTSGGSTIFFNVFSHQVKNFIIDETLPEGNLFINNNTVIASVYDIAGQISDDEEELLETISPFLKQFSGITYLIDATKPNIDYIKKTDKTISEWYEKMNLKKPLTTVYVSKSMTDNARIKLSNIIDGDYKNLKEVIDFCEKTSSALFIGDSIGNTKGKIKPELYMIKTFNKVLEFPIETDVYSPVSATIILPRLETRRGIRSLEKPLVNILKEYEVI